MDTIIDGAYLKSIFKKTSCSSPFGFEQNTEKDWIEQLEIAASIDDRNLINRRLNDSVQIEIIDYGVHQLTVFHNQTKSASVVYQCSHHKENFMGTFSGYEISLYLTNNAGEIKTIPMIFIPLDLFENQKNNQMCFCDKIK